MFMTSLTKRKKKSYISNSNRLSKKKREFGNRFGIQHIPGSNSDLAQMQPIEEEEELQMKSIHDPTLQMMPISSTPPSIKIIQKDDDDSGIPSPDAEDSSFDFDFNALPPSLQLSLGQWMLRANTSQTALQYTQGLMKYSLGYNYGSSITAGISSPGSSTSLGFDPHSGNTSFNLRRDQFRFGASANPISNSYGLNLGYGASLLPMPSALSDSVNAGWSGASNVLGGIPDMQDPLSFYQAHGDDIDSIMKAVKAVSSLDRDEDDPSFGAGLTITYNPENRWLIYGGVQWIF
jgi:hypothetical protein